MYRKSQKTDTLTYELIITGLQLQQLQFINNALSKHQELGEGLRKAMQASDVPTQLK
jgi:hypothetical protein